jgi:sugar lactone lactonase YvrE
MRAAAESWPTQQVYLEAAASLAAAARDTADAAAWLERLAALGVGPRIGGDTSFAALAGAAAFDSAAARLRRATDTVTNGRVRLTLADTMFHPEGVAFDARTGRWFVGSVRQRRIVAVERHGASRDFVAPAADGIGGVFGMAVDTERRMLWVATTALPRMMGFTAADSGRVGVFGYDIDTGRLRRRAWLRADSSAHMFGDVVVAPNGDVYASDSQSPWMLKVPVTADTLERFMTHPLFRSLQGMAIARDGRTMFVADYSHGVLRVDLVTRTAAAVRAASGVTLLGIDGLYVHDGALIAVQNGVVPARVMRFCLDGAGTRVHSGEVLDRNPAVAGEPTLGAVVGDSLFYVGSSQWETFDEAGRRRPGTSARPVTVIGVRLDGPRACRAR